MLKKSWLMKKSKSRDNYVNLNKILCTIRKDLTFALNELCRSNLNFRAKILIKLSFKRLKTLLQIQTFLLYYWHVQQTFSKSSLIPFHLKNVRSFRKNFFIHIDRIHTSNTLKKSFKKKLIIWTLYNENKDRYYNIIDASLSIRKDSFRKLRIVRSFRNQYVHVRFRNDSRQVWAAILSLNCLKLKISSFPIMFLFRTYIIS